MNANSSLWLVITGLLLTLVAGLVFIQWRSKRASVVSDDRYYGPVYRYGMLLLAAGLLLWHGWWLVTLSPAYPYDRYGGAVVPLMLLLNHLTSAFRWSRTTTTILQVASWAWIVLGSIYIYYLSDVWFPTR